MSTVAIVGAGIVGASVAYHLACRGVPVTLIDRAPSPAAGATGDSFGWIGDAGGEWPGGAEDSNAAVAKQTPTVAARNATPVLVKTPAWASASAAAA